MSKPNDGVQLVDLDALEKAAHEVKDWGNCCNVWLDTSEDVAAAVVGHINEDGDTYPVATVDCDQYYAAQDSIKLARFYAAANPVAVLALLDRLRASEDRAQLLLEAKNWWADKAKAAQAEAQRLIEERNSMGVTISRALSGNVQAAYALAGRMQQVAHAGKAAARYEKLRTLTPNDFMSIWRKALAGDGSFDDLLDEFQRGA